MSIIIKGGASTKLANVDSAGNLMVTNEGQKATYRAAINTALPSSGVGIAATIFGSATKLVKLTHIFVNFKYTTAQLNEMFFIRYSTLPSGGTSSALSPSPMDTNDAAYTATNINVYSVYPTEGTRNGRIQSWLAMSGSASVAPQNGDFLFNGPGAQPLVLRGTSDGIAVFINTAGAAGGSMDGFFEWTEE